MTDLETKKIYEIADKLGKEEILCQLSEECSELIQACLKYRRTMKGLTPKTEDEIKENLFEELADVLNYCIQMANKLGVDPKQIVLDKMEKTAKKYPVEKAKGKSTKYNKL